MVTLGLGAPSILKTRLIHPPTVLWCEFSTLFSVRNYFSKFLGGKSDFFFQKMLCKLLVAVVLLLALVYNVNAQWGYGKTTP